MRNQAIGAIRAATAMAAALAIAPAGMVAAAGDRPASAQAAAPGKPAPERRITRQPRPRIEVHPDRLIYRECVDTTREVWRPYWGYVVMPDMKCWWVRGK